MHRELCNKAFALPFVHDELRELGLSLSRSSESIEHQTDLCSICDLFLKVASMFRKYNIQCRSSTIVKQWWHRTLEVISHISKYRVFPMLLIISFDFSLNGLNAWSFFQVSFQRFAIWMSFKLMDQLFDCFPAGVILSLDN